MEKVHYCERFIELMIDLEVRSRDEGGAACFSVLLSNTTLPQDLYKGNIYRTTTLC